MNRRQFCQTTLNLGLFSIASSLLPSRVWAQANSLQAPHFFVLVRVDGGWDTSLSMDPWIADQRPSELDYFLEYRKEDLLPFADSFVGPALKPLEKHFSRMSIINGIFMSASDGGHESSAIYAATGNGQGELGALPLELEGRLQLSPFGTLANTAPYVGHTNRPIWDLNDLVREGSVGGADLILDLEDKATDLSRAREAMLKNRNKIEVFNKYLASYPERSTATSIAAGFRSGLSYSAYYNQSSTSLDTHSGHERTHLSALSGRFAEISGMLDVFANSAGVAADGSASTSSSLLDQTTFMIVSEFTRTPALNGSKGKDHNPQANSAIVISPYLKNIKIGQAGIITRAQSRWGVPYLAGLPLDTKTYQPVYRRTDSFILRPDNVVATIATALGVKPGQISKGLADATVLSTLLK